ncbi:hypothetical protein [Brevibacillus migulae]|uniref:hypothetical protein n=1 Tax=Brevibacillus migulae TaxID=1644114 RepID=UPI00106ECD78|nr:hypothetical protein [Brevibacillus migulae]
MKKKIVLVLDVEMTSNVEMQELTDKMSQAIQTVDGIKVNNLVMFDNDENSSDRLIANIKKEL